MNLHSAQKDLYRSTFLIGGWRRARALTYLTRAMEPKAVDILVEAFLTGCPCAKKIEIFFKTVKDRTKLDRLWLNWAHRGENTLAGILMRRHKPASVESGQELRVLSLLLLGKLQEIEAGKELVKGLVGWDKALRNEKIIEALTNYFKDCDGKPADWILVLSLLLGLFDAIGDSREAADRVSPFLADADRDISSAAKEFTAQLPQPVKIYLILSLLDDPDADVNPKIISEQVFKSGDGNLVNVYRKAFSHRGKFNTELVKKSLMASSNEDGLFEEARRMTFIEVLDLCQRWAKNKWRPDDLRRANVVKTAVERFRQIEEIEATEGAPPPAGTENLFLYWEKQNLSEKELKKGLSHPDPFVRMRSLYLGHPKGMVGEARLDQAAKSDDWPERLISRMIHPAVTPDEKRDHVEWVNVCSGMDADILNARIDCTPEEYSRYNEMLVTLSRGGAAMARLKMLLEILLAFQGYFMAGGVVVATDDGAKGCDAIETEDLSVDEANLSY